MYVVRDLFEARDLRLVTLPVAETAVFLCRLGGGSWSETVEEGVVSGFTRLLRKVSEGVEGVRDLLRVRES